MTSRTSLIVGTAFAIMGATGAIAAPAGPSDLAAGPGAETVQFYFGTGPSYGYGPSPGYGYYGPPRGGYYGYGGPRYDYYDPPPPRRLVCRVRLGPYGPREVCWRR